MEETMTLERLTDLEVRLYRLETKSHLRIGAGEGAVDISAAGNPLIRALVYNEKKPEGSKDRRVPYIPGSSLHGVIRSWVEKALRSAETQVNVEAKLEGLEDEDTKAKVLDDARSGFKAMLGLGEKDDLSPEQLYKEWRVYPSVCDPMLDVDKCERISGREGEARAWKRDWWEAIGRPMPCHVCRVFGYMGQRGKVKISHAFPIREDIPVDIITRVAINRLTGAADEGKLFDLEAIPPGVSFYFFTVLENLSPEDKANFDKGIRALTLQLAAVGAHSTIGFGMVEVGPVYRASIKPKIFDRKVEEDIKAISVKAKDLVEPLDTGKYPHFFLALSSRSKPTFGGLVTYT